MTLIETALLSVFGLIGTGYISALAHATSRPGWKAPPSGKGARPYSAAAALSKTILLESLDASSGDARPQAAFPSPQASERFAALAHDGSPHDTVRAAARSIGRMAAALRDAAPRSALQETVCVLEDVADLILRDPSCVRSARDLLDHHLPKSHDVARAFAILSAQPRLSHAETAELERVSRTIAEMPDFFTAHLHAIRECQLLGLANDHETLRVIAFELERPGARVPSAR